jgi:hypothetical protein
MRHKTGAGFLTIIVFAQGFSLSLWVKLASGVNFDLWGMFTSSCSPPESNTFFSLEKRKGRIDGLQLLYIPYKIYPNFRLENAPSGNPGQPYQVDKLKFMKLENDSRASLTALLFIDPQCPLCESAVLKRGEGPSQLLKRLQVTFYCVQYPHWNFCQGCQKLHLFSNQNSNLSKFWRVLKWKRLV